MTIRALLLPALIGAICGFGGAAGWSASGLGGDTRDAEMRAYLLENPEILPEMAAAYDRQQAAERLANVEGGITTPFPGAVLGNPEGAITLVEFTDYGCGFCRQSHADVLALTKTNPDLRVVVREWPIFDGSDGAARMALAAADQGKFAAFHNAMFSGDAPGDASVNAAAATAGLDMDKAEAFAASQAVDMELAKNMSLAQQLGFTGTPSWVVGDQVLQGAVGEEQLQAAISAARANAGSTDS